MTIKQKVEAFHKRQAEIRTKREELKELQFQHDAQTIGDFGIHDGEVLDLMALVKLFTMLQDSK